MKKIISSNKGTSLIEILIYLGLLSIVLFISIDISLKATEQDPDIETKQALQKDATFITSRLAYDIRRAETIATPIALGDTNNNLNLAIGTNTYNYSLNGSNIVFEQTIGATTTTGNLNSNQTKINSLNFKKLGNVGGKPNVKIIFEIETTSRSKRGPQIQTFETVVGLR